MEDDYAALDPDPNYEEPKPVKHSPHKGKVVFRERDADEAINKTLSELQGLLTKRQNNLRHYQREVEETTQEIERLEYKIETLERYSRGKETVTLVIVEPGMRVRRPLDIDTEDE